MTDPERHCTSCGLSLTSRGTTQFTCPQCGTGAIGRCSRCRDQSVPYHCPSCDFVGP